MSARKPLSPDAIVGWVSGSVGRSVSWSDGKSKLSHVWSHQSICRFEEFGPGGSVRPRSASRPTPLGPHLGLHSPRASLKRSRPEVGHTSGFTAPAGCPRWGHSGEARGVPHPLPCPGYRIPHISFIRLARTSRLHTFTATHVR